MRRGALVMIDALGFKGIWNRVEPAKLISKLKALRQEANDHLDASFQGTRHLLATTPSNSFELVDVAFLSDTIVLAAAVKDPMVHANWICTSPELDDTIKKSILAMAGDPRNRRRQDAFALMVASHYAAQIVRLGATLDPALAYRGCVAFGDFEIDGTFIVGRAVDEAATHMDSAQGAIVWFTPAARAIMDGNDDLGCARYEVPLKGGDTYETFVVNPFHGISTPEECDDVAQRILGTFSGPLDVHVKRQRTLEYLRACRHQWKPPKRAAEPPVAPSGG